MTLHSNISSDVKMSRCENSSEVSKISSIAIATSHCDVTFHSNIGSNVQMSREDAKIVAR